MSAQPEHIPLASRTGRRTLFWKLLMLVSITAVLGTVSIAFYFQYVLRDTYKEFLQEQIGSYMYLVADAIGAPPDTLAARHLTIHYPLDIRIEGQHASWSSAPDIASAMTVIAEGERTGFDAGQNFLFRNHNDHLYAVMKMPGQHWRYVIRLRSIPQRTSWFPPSVLLGFVLTILFAGAYYSVQRFLRPIGELMKGVAAVSSGDFEYRVRTDSTDELGELSHAFNAMSEQVAAIIASKRRLLFDVSHELRSPLTRMGVALSMLPESKARTSLDRNIRELNTMITELLENERLAVLGGKLVTEQFDVVALVRSIIDSLGADTRRLEFDSLTESLSIVADNQRLAIAVKNVISNALKYSSEADGPVKVTVFPDDEGVRVVVADSGIGIPPEAQEKVFEPFYRTDDSRSRATGGYGLGLSLTKSIVEAHGGTIQLKSTVGSGTTINMWIPNTPIPEAVVRTVTSREPARERVA